MATIERQEPEVAGSFLCHVCDRRGAPGSRASRYPRNHKSRTRPRRHTQSRDSPPAGPGVTSGRRWPTTIGGEYRVSSKAGRAAPRPAIFESKDQPDSRPAPPLRGLRGSQRLPIRSAPSAAGTRCAPRRDAGVCAARVRHLLPCGRGTSGLLTAWGEADRDRAGVKLDSLPVLAWLSDGSRPRATRLGAAPALPRA